MEILLYDGKLYSINISKKEVEYRLDNYVFQNHQYPKTIHDLGSDVVRRIDSVKVNKVFSINNNRLYLGYSMSSSDSAKRVRRLLEKNDTISIETYCYIYKNKFFVNSKNSIIIDKIDGVYNFENKKTNELTKLDNLVYNYCIENKFQIILYDGSW